MCGHAGKMFLIDFEQQRIIPDDELKETMATSREYTKYAHMHACMHACRPALIIYEDLR